jgi:AraC-like DNA-binding protein
MSIDPRFGCDVEHQDRAGSASVSAYRIATTRRLLIRDMWFPFPVDLTVRRGSAEMSQSGRDCRSLRTGSRVLPSMTVIAVYVSPDAGGAAEILLDPPGELSSIGERSFMERIRTALDQKAFTRRLTRELATAVFCLPQADWSMSRLASVLGINRQRLSQRLNWENQCLTEIVRQQRYQRTLLELLNTNPELATARQIGTSRRAKQAELAHLFVD